MTFLDLVRKKKSTRRYSSKPVSRNTIDRCLDAARLSPSACNAQPWSFVVVDDPNLKNALAEKAFSGIYSINSFAKAAPVLIVVITERTSYAASLGGAFRGVQYSLIDIGIACEHFVLQAEDLGLGTCWIGWFNERGVKSTLGIPQHKKIDMLIALGYYDREKLGPEHDREPMDKIASFNSY